MCRAFIAPIHISNSPPSPPYGLRRGKPTLRRPCSLRRGGAVVAPGLSRAFLFPRPNAEGTERRVAPILAAPRKQVYAVCATHLRFEARAPLAKGARPAALHRGFLSPRRRSFRAGQEGAPLLDAPYPAGFRPPSFPPRPALEGQPVLMPADGWPGPPERGVTSPARGRRALLHHRDVSRRRPQPSQASGAWTGSVAEIWIIFLEFFSAIFPRRTVSPRYGRGTSRFRRACCCARSR